MPPGLRCSLAGTNTSSVITSQTVASSFLLVSVVLGNCLTRKFGRTGVGNEQTTILGTTALRSIQGLSKSSLGQARLRTQSRDQSCRDSNHLRTLHGTRLRGVVASSLPQCRNRTKIEPVPDGIGRVFSPHCVTRSALSLISKFHDLDGGTPHNLGMQLTFPVQIPTAVLTSTALHFNVFEAIVSLSLLDTGTALPHVQHERR